MSLESPSPPSPADEESFVSLLAGEHSRLLGYIRTLVPHRRGGWGGLRR